MNGTTATKQAARDEKMPAPTSAHAASGTKTAKAASGVDFPFRSPEGREAILAFYDAIVEKWPVPCRQREVPTRFGTAAALEWGRDDAPVLILLHGSSSNATSWIGDAVAYGADHHVFALDLPGDCGRSAPRRPALEGGAYADWLADALDGLLPEGAPIRLIGMSLGGWVAMHYASRYAGRVERLGLFCPAGLGPAKRSFLLSILLYSLAGERGQRRLFRRMAGSTPVPEEAIDFMMTMLRSFRPITAPIPLLPDDALKALSMPILLVLGGQDTLLDSAASRRRAEQAMPTAACRWLPEDSHMLVNRAADMVPFMTGQ